MKLRSIRSWIAGCLLVALGGCGFTLRGDYSLPGTIKTIEVLSTGHNMALQRALEKRLKPYKLTIVDKHSDDNHADLSLTILPDELDRRILSLFATGQVAEYELIYTVNYHLQFSGEEAQPISFTITREYQDDPDAVLAKSRELDLVLGEMRQQAADRIIRQISTSYANQHH